MDLRQKLALRRSTVAVTEPGEGVNRGATAPGTTAAGHGDAAPVRGGPSVAGVQPPEGHDSEHAQRVARLRGMLDQMVARQKFRDKAEPRPPVALADRGRRHHLRTGPLPGGVVETAHGPMHVVTNVLEPHHCHGKVPVVGATRACPTIVAKLALDVRLAEPSPRGYLYLDTETTGLMGGTGTLPFLTGMAWFEDESLTVEQILLRTPADEPAMLHHFAARLAKASAIVTYNGKSFDWPLLRNRFVLNRMVPPPDPLHLDLLHAARRVFKRRLGEVRLTTIERALLGFRREYDVDGHEIPALYWSMIRSADGSMLTPVIEHNLNDLVALAGVLATLSDRFENLRPEDDPSDHLGLANVAARADDPDRARAFAHAAATGGGEHAVTTAALVLAARLAQKRQDDLEALRLYREALVAASPPDAPAVHLALAKLYERGLADPTTALVHAAHTAPAEGAEKQARRVERLAARVERLRGSGVRRSHTRSVERGGAGEDALVSEVGG